MGMVKKSDAVVLGGVVVGGVGTDTLVDLQTKNALLTPVAKPQESKPKPCAFGRELTPYELEKDRRIGVAGVVQAVIGSEWYAQIAELTDLNNKDAVGALRKMAEEEITYWLDVIKAKSE